MRKAQGIRSLLDYLESVGYPLSKEHVDELVLNRQIPHTRPISDIIIFNLEHIDWWIKERKKA